MRLKKKACPGKSRPLLTYEKHQVQISDFRNLLKIFFGELGKCWGQSIGRSAYSSNFRRSRPISNVGSSANLAVLGSEFNFPAAESVCSAFVVFSAVRAG